MSGIESLRQPQYGQQWNQPQPHGKSPWVALLFALVPGLGAAYNGQPIKALCHFALPVSLWQLADVFHGGPAFGAALGGSVLYLFSLYDAWHTAQRARAGADLSADDARIKQWLQAHVHVWASLLIAVGGLSLLEQIVPHLARRAWPVLLILVGVFLLKEHFSASSASAQTTSTPPPNYQPRPVSFMTTGLSENQPNTQSSNLINAANRFDRWG